MYYKLLHKFWLDKILHLLPDKDDHDWLYAAAHLYKKANLISYGQFKFESTRRKVKNEVRSCSFGGQLGLHRSGDWQYDKKYLNSI